MVGDARKRGGPQLLLRFPEGSDLRERLDVAAKENNRSLSAEIVHRLEISLRVAPSETTAGQPPDLAERVSQLEQSFLIILNNIGKVVERLDRAKI